MGLRATITTAARTVTLKAVGGSTGGINNAVRHCNDTLSGFKCQRKVCTARHNKFDMSASLLFNCLKIIKFKL